jgi:FkbM family methyltransferase
LKMPLTSYAQNFEDVMLWRALKHIEKGCYVDVGAQHPVIDSVSKTFYEQGWRGVHIEPVPEFSRLLREDRPDETVLEVALSDREGTLELNVISATGLSTAVDVYAQRHQAEHGFDCQALHVPVLTLKSALQSLAGQDVHWLKIDVEGFEGQVLKGWDSQVLRPWIMVVEATIPNSRETDYLSWDPMLVAADYQFVYFDGLNRFYVAKEHAELVSAFLSPPNVFDEIELTASSTLCGSVLATYHAREIELAELAEARCLQAEAKTAEAEAKTAEAEAKTAEAEAKTAEAEAKTNQVENDLEEVLNSRSWRYTQQLRQLSMVFKQGAFCRPSLLLRDLRFWVHRRPKLRKAVKSIIVRLPDSLRHRLHLVVHGTKTVTNSLELAAHQPTDLAPRAASIYNELKQTIGVGEH